MAQLCSDPHAQFAEHPLAPAVVKASGPNYLAQSLHEGASALAIPTSRGNVCLHRWSAGGLPSDALSVLDAAPEAASSLPPRFTHWDEPAAGATDAIRTLGEMAEARSVSVTCAWRARPATCPELLAPL